MATPEASALEWEGERRSKAALAAILAGIFAILANVAAVFIARDQPATGLLNAVRDAAKLPLVASSKGLRTDEVVFANDHAAQAILVYVIAAAGSLLAGLTLAYLFRAARARKAGLPQVGLILVVAGAVMVAVGRVVNQVALVVSSHGYVSDGAAMYSTAGAHDVFTGPGVIGGAIVYGLGNFLFGGGVIITSLNAMRVGLLTRFMGVLGMIVGVLVILGFQAVTIIEAFWIVALGMLFVSRWPGGSPPAWATGEAMPWPSQAEMRAARGQGGRGAKPAAPAPVVADDEAGTPHPSSKKKKRKRR